MDTLNVGDVLSSVTIRGSTISIGGMYSGRRVVGIDVVVTDGEAGTAASGDEPAVPVAEPRLTIAIDLYGGGSFVDAAAVESFVRV